MTKSEKIELISALDIGPGQLAMLALVVLGEIPAVDIDLFEQNAPCSEVMSVLSAIEVTVYTAAPPANAAKAHIVTLCISTSPDNARRLKELVDINNASETASTSFDMEYGTLMGYPQSAIEGYVTNNKLPDSKYPYWLRDDLLTVFRLSKDHWSTEIRTILSWRDTLARQAPEILRRLDGIMVKE